MYWDYARQAGILHSYEKDIAPTRQFEAMCPDCGHRAVRWSNCFRCWWCHDEFCSAEGKLTKATFLAYREDDRNETLRNLTAQDCGSWTSDDGKVIDYWVIWVPECLTEEEEKDAEIAYEEGLHYYEEDIDG